MCGEDIDPMVRKVVQAGTPKVVWTLPGQIHSSGGKSMIMIMIMSYRVNNAKAKRVLGRTPRYPSFRRGLPATVEAIERGEVTA